MNVVIFKLLESELDKLIEKNALIRKQLATYMSNFSTLTGYIHLRESQLNYVRPVLSSFIV